MPPDPISEAVRLAEAAIADFEARMREVTPVLAADRTAKQNEQLFHLLAVCPRCREVGGWLLELHQANALPPIFGPIDAALARSRAEAPRLLEELLHLALEERLARLDADQRFVSWGLAIKLLDDAVKLFLHGEHRDPHLAGRSLISKAFLLTEMGESESALRTLQKANGLIDPAREPRLLLCLRHNLVDNLSKAGRHREADALLPDLRELAAAQGGTMDRLRLRWVEGRVAAGLGEHERARQLLDGVRQAFLDDRNPFEAALATLDLVVSHLEEGNTAEVRVLADEMVAVFRAHDVSREALAAVLLFQEAAHREAATAELAREVATSIARARGDAPKRSERK